MFITRTITLSAIALFVITGCDNNELQPSKAQGGGAPDGGDGGTSAPDEGGGGEGAGGNEGGMGGLGGMGGNEGGGGGDPACSSWSECCVDACSKLENSCGQPNLCGNLGVACGGAPTTDPIGCIITCFADDDATCDHFNRWLDPNDKPPSPNELAQCVAACPGAFNGTSPDQGMLNCAATYCDMEADNCYGEQACYDWYVACAQQCSTPDCWLSCTQAHPSQNEEALTNCMCGIQTTLMGQSAPQPAWFGTADCGDIILGRMDACAL